MHKQKAENWNKLTDDCSYREMHKQTHRQNKQRGKCTITWMEAKAYYIRIKELVASKQCWHKFKKKCFEEPINSFNNWNNYFFLPITIICNYN